MVQADTHGPQSRRPMAGMAMSRARPRNLAIARRGNLPGSGCHAEASSDPPMPGDFHDAPV
jgi:hypothetical protein